MINLSTVDLVLAFTIMTTLVFSSVRIGMLVWRVDLLEKRCDLLEKRDE